VTGQVYTKSPKKAHPLLHLFGFLKAQIFSDKDDMRRSPAGCSFENEERFTGSVRRVAVGAAPGACAWRLKVEPKSVRWSRLVPCSRDRLVQAVRDFIQSDDENQRVLPPRHAAHSVSVAVDVHQQSVEGDRIRTGEKIVGQKLIPKRVHSLFRRQGRVPVMNYAAPSLRELFHGADFADCDAARDADGSPFRYELQYLIEGFFFRLNIESMKAPLLKSFHQCASQPVAVLLSGCVELIRQYHRLPQREYPL